ncbi:MAG: phosphate acyltransferase PlsX [Oscillospiraceae bacterium]
MKIIVDAFGGDHAPLEAIKGSQMATEQYGISVILAGDEMIIREVAKKNGISLENIEIVNAQTVIPIEEDPTEILKKYNDSSMAVGLKLLSDGKGDAFVSAGSTGALVVGSTLIVKRMKGVKRAALTGVIPNEKGGYMLLDIGANIECRPEMLVQFAIMGSAYMDKILGRKNPTVGLVNIGSEETKGLDLQVQAHGLLKKAPVNFVGNVEPRYLPSGSVDVAVTDGFTGNIILKLTEGLGSTISRQIKGIFLKNVITKIGALFVYKGINDFKKSMDYTELGGAPLLGISKPVIKAHGSSNAKAFKNAIRQAKNFVENKVIEEIAETLLQLKESNAMNQD